MSVGLFGRLDGVEVPEIALSGPDGMSARVIGWGAVLRELVVTGPRGRQSVVLGLESLEDYVRYSPNFGAIPGRYANRIADARFRLDGREFRLLPNENGNQLHGGPDGFAQRVWSLEAHDGASALLRFVSPHGDQGYPGRLVATCLYQLLAPATLRITLEASADAPTPVNLTTHSYYNLDGSADVRDHLVQVHADHFTPTDAADIPTGAIAPVTGTRFDFRAPRRLRGSGRYEDIDINFVLRRERGSEAVLEAGQLAHAATVSSTLSGLALELWTSEPGLQLYDGHKIDIPVPGLGGVRYGRYAGLPLEPQRFPDGPNRSYFPPCILRPGEVSRQVSEVRFRTI